MHRRGFTLIELLVATALTAIIAGSLGAVVSSALTVWRRLTRADRAAVRPQLALERLTTDLRNSHRWTGIAFEGKASRVAWSAPVGDPADPEAKTVGRISYWLDDRGRLCRAEDRYAGLGQEAAPGCQVVATDLAAFDVAYYGRDPDRNEWAWLPRWPANERLPVAVQATLTLRQPPGAQWTDVVLLPTTPTR